MTKANDNAPQGLENSRRKEPGLVRALLQDERGAVLMEFALAFYLFFVLLFGILQVGHLVLASHYLTYANFMACRSASVLLDLKESGLMSEESFSRRVLRQAAYSLGPLEASLWRRPEQTEACGRVEDRLRFRWRYSGEAVSEKQSRPLQTAIRGRLEYRFPLVFPFVNYLIASFDSLLLGRDIPESPSSNGFPSIVLSSSYDLGALGETESSPRAHPFAAARRWRD